MKVYDAAPRQQTLGKPLSLRLKRVSDEIIMDPDAVLGPLDPQILVGNTVYPAPSLVKVAKLKGEGAREEFLVLADVAEKAVNEIQNFIITF